MPPSQKEQFFSTLAELQVHDRMYRHACNVDFEFYKTDSYLSYHQRIIDILNGSLDTQDLTPEKVIRKMKAEIRSISEESSFAQNLSLPHEALTIVSVAEALLKKRKEKINQSKKLQTKIINACEKSEDNIEAAAESLFEIFSQNKEDILMVNISTAINKLGANIQKATKYYKKVRTFLALCEEIMAASDEEVNEINISTFLYGLKNLDAASVPQELLISLANKIQCSKNVHMSNKRLAQAFYGLQNLNPLAVPSELIKALTEKVKESNNDPVHGRDIGMILYGLQNIDASVVPPELLEIFASKVNETDKPFNEQNIAMALYGLQGIDPPTMSAELLDAIREKLELLEKFESRGVALSLFGLASSKDMQEAKEIVKILIQHLDTPQIRDELNQDKGITFMLVQGLSIHDIVLPEWLEQIYEKWIERQTEGNSSKENEAYRILEAEYPQKTWQQGVFIDGFELDIYEPNDKTNFEIDGGIHKKKFNRDKIRDRNLKEKYGIQVFRIKID